MNALLTLFLTRLLWAGQNPLQATGTPVCNPSEQFQINVFDDFLEPGVVSWSWGGDYDFENASPVFEVGIKRDFFSSIPKTFYKRAVWASMAISTLQLWNTVLTFQAGHSFCRSSL